MYGATPRCPRCEKSVYAAEQVLGPGRKFYHKPCLSCNICRRRLDSYNLVEHDEEPYCKPCHVKNFGTRDLRHQNLPLAARPRSSSSASSSSSPSPPQQPLSPTRQLTVNVTGTNALLRPTRALSPTTTTFPRPRPRSMSSSDSGSGSGNQSNRSSLYGSEPILEEPERASASLASVAQRLNEEPDSTDSAKATVTPILPEPDYTRATITPLRSNTGRPGTGALPRTVPLPLDYGARFARHQSTQSLDGSVKTHNTSSSTSSTSSFSSPMAARGATMDAINLLQQEGIMNPLQASPTGARFPLSRTPTARSEKETEHTSVPLQSSPTGTRYGATLSRASTLSSQGTGSPRKWGGTTPLCPACSKNVYFAEQVKAVGKTYHKACLRCTECRTGLDSTRLRDHDGIPFCVRCYGKLYGPQGHGYALLGKAGA